MRKRLLCLAFLASSCFGARIKDIATLKGARANQLFGYGIVVGLAGSGDKANELTESSLGLVLRGLGVDVKSQKMDTKNAAAVVVTATLPPYSKTGTRLDVNVSSVGSASSLDSGNLMMSSLRGADGKVYAMASGKVLAMKKMAQGGGGGQGGGSSGGQNLVTGLIPGGAILERELPQNLSQLKEFRYQLINPDFTTAVRMARRINEELGGKYATPVDAATVDILPPYHYEPNPVELLAQVEVIEVEADTRSKVVINSKTGTVVLGDQVKIAPVAIAQGNLKIEIKEDRSVATENANNAAEAGAGDTAKKEQKLIVMKKGASIADIASSLNEMGASSDDLVSLLQALKASGALMAEIEVQ